MADENEKVNSAPSGAATTRDQETDNTNLFGTTNALNSVTTSEKTETSQQKEPNVKLPKFEAGKDAYERMSNWVLWRSDIVDYFTIKKSIVKPAERLAHVRLEGGNDIKRALINFIPADGSEADEFEQAMQHLTMYFTCGVNDVSLIKKFHEAKQEENEAFNMYAQRVIMAGMIAGIHQGTQDHQLVAQLLAGARNKYFVQQASFWTGKPLSEVIQIGTMMDSAVETAEKESKKSITSEDSDETVARFEKPSGSNFGAQRNNYRGNFRGSRNSGYPNNRFPGSGFQQRSRGGGSFRGGFKCWNCNRTGHRARDCQAEDGGMNKLGASENQKVRKPY